MADIHGYLHSMACRGLGLRFHRERHDLRLSYHHVLRLDRPQCARHHGVDGDVLSVPGADWNIKVGGGSQVQGRLQ